MHRRKSLDRLDSLRKPRAGFEGGLTSFPILPVFFVQRSIVIVKHVNRLVSFCNRYDGNAIIHQIDAFCIRYLGSHVSAPPQNSHPRLSARYGGTHPYGSTSPVSQQHEVPLAQLQRLRFGLRIMVSTRHGRIIDGRTNRHGWR